MKWTEISDLRSNCFEVSLKIEQLSIISTEYYIWWIQNLNPDMKRSNIHCSVKEAFQDLLGWLVLCFKMSTVTAHKSSQIPSLCPWMIVLCFCCEWQEGTQSLPKWTQHFIDRGTRETVGGWQKRTRGERDRWMEEAEREDCEGGTDGGEKGDSSEEGNGGLREEGDWVNREERNGRGWRGV